MKTFSVTRVLSPWAEEDFREQGISEKKLANAASRGSLTHDWCLYGYAMKIYQKPLPEIYQGYGESFKKWFDKHVVKVIWVEKELADPELGIVGHPDLLAKIDLQNSAGVQLGLVDLKTPVDYSAYWQVQLSTYDHLVRKSGWEPDWVGSLQLDIKGRAPTPHRHKFAHRDFAIFLQALNVRRYLG